MINVKRALRSGVIVAAVVCHSTCGITSAVDMNSDQIESKMQAGFSWVIDDSLA